MPYNMGEYYERVSDYDLEYQSQSELDIPFWCELVMRYTPRRVLELACGSGRIGIELLHSPGDFQLEGLDIAPEMLDAYRRKLAREPEAVSRRVTLHEGDMTDYLLEHKGQFDLVFLPFNSIAHLYEIEQQLATFKNTYDHLVDGGRFVVDIFLPDIDYLSDALNRPSHVYLEDEISDPNDEFTMLLYTSKDPSHAALGTDIYDADKSHVGRSPFESNAALVFVPSNITYHGFERRKIDGVRKSIIINYVTNEWRAREQLAFPTQPIKH